MKELIDLHTHTNYSDGDLSPSELINLAINSGIKTLAITDHDTVEGIKKVSALEYSDIQIISGIELSSQFPKGRMHILGYDYDINNPDLNKKLDELKELLNETNDNSIKEKMKQIVPTYKEPSEVNEVAITDQ